MEMVNLVVKQLSESSNSTVQTSGLKPETVKQINTYLEQARKFNFSKEIVKVSVDAIVAALEGKK